MRPKDMPPLTILHSYYTYDPNTGTLVKIKASSKRCKVGEPVGSVSSQGYLVTTLRGQRLSVHRVCYKLFYGVEPEIVDHVNGDKTDNRINNLRSVNHKENNRNRLKAKGVTKIKSGSYRATIWLHGSNQDIGYFSKEEDAIDAYNEKRRELGWIV